MSNKQQTALEWYAHRLYEIEIAYNQGVIDTEVYAKSKIHALEQAKEMHKEEIEKVSEDWWNEGASYVSGGERKYESFEQYYNKTYGGTK